MLRGYAGTGKTSLVGALVRTLDKLQQKSVLLAPTGRAAKVFSAYAGHPAFTIHKKIYRQQSFSNELSNFSVNDNLTTHTLYIVDEASMISNEGLSGSMFGTGRLLGRPGAVCLFRPGMPLVADGRYGAVAAGGGGAESCPFCRCLERLRAGSGGGGLDAGGAPGTAVGYFVERHPPAAVDSGRRLLQPAEDKGFGVCRH